MSDKKVNQGKLQEVAPGRYVAAGNPPEMVVAEVVRLTDGKLGLRPGGRYVKLGPAVARALGMERQLKTLRRLATAGFVTLYQPSPAVWMLDLDSWFQHLDATAEDPDFWDPEGENHQRYLFKNGLRLKRGTK